ncbi:MAG TPA: acyltransferase [Longimicrobiaceae bacterium]|nr:acyltransferase [Longimicrobiaceae bacterium]
MTAPESATPAPSSATARPWRGHILALDGLRGIAILLVMLLHFQLDKPDTSLGRAYANIVDSGWAGVDLFFVLSGFLITGILYDNRSDPHYFRNFYVRRLLRIFPLYYGFLVLRFLVAPHLFQPEWVDLQAPAADQAWAWLYLVNLQYSLPGTGHPAPFVGHFWSLAIEEQFYLVWPAVVLALGRRSLVRLCCAMVVGALALRGVFVFALENYGAAYYFTPARMDALALGSLIALVARGETGRGVAALLRWRRPVLVGTGAALAVLYTWRGLWWQDPIVGTVGFSLVALFFAAVLVTAVDAPPGSRLGRAFANPVLLFFGRYSYSLYVFHLVVHRVLKKTVFNPDQAPAFVLGVPLQLAFLVTATAISVVLAVASWHLFEKHFLKLKGRFEHGRPPRPESVPVGMGPQTA